MEWRRKSLTRWALALGGVFVVFLAFFVGVVVGVPDDETDNESVPEPPPASPTAPPAWSSARDTSWWVSPPGTCASTEHRDHSAHTDNPERSWGV